MKYFKRKKHVFYISRYVWVVLIVVGAGFTVFQIQNRMRYYAGYPVNVIIRVEDVEEMRFPTVTICNENRASLAKVTAMGEWLIT